ncbi:hypothetical protein ACTXPC_15610 [Brachybacterium alimentarium]|uniref:hypothetical protein n=1 Tax=Brachybacterium alimentarium TaxID=47845 RepID=UPI000DF10DEE|nr:hypothetical protein [Brachybacterium alimentarium]RCS74941.1 hypothetical protein CIK70_17580 [Brachybacterium alimentarium]
MENIDTEELATRAVQQARRLTHQAELAAKVAMDQAVALLHARGLSQREIAKLTGLSKSDVARRTGSPATRGPLLNRAGDDRVYAFADEWIWGSREIAQFVANELRAFEGGPSRAFTREEIERDAQRMMEWMGGDGDDLQPLRGMVRIEPNAERPKQCAGGVCGHCETCRAEIAARPHPRTS